MKTENNKILLLGVGNDILMDDGIGPRIVNELRPVLAADRFDFANINLGGLEILEFIKDYNEVVIVDAIRTKEGEPGEVYLLTPDDFTETCHLSNFHDVSFLTALKLGDCLNMGVPDSILIFAVEIVEDSYFSTRLSPELEVKYEEIYEEVRSILHILEDNTGSITDIINKINHNEKA